ncbi:MAG: hypothetical protein ACXW3G_14530, partial [Rhodoplanes sp.]
PLPRPARHSAAPARTAVYVVFRKHPPWLLDARLARSMTDGMNRTAVVKPGNDGPQGVSAARR